MSIRYYWPPPTTLPPEELHPWLLPIPAKEPIPSIPAPDPPAPATPTKPPAATPATAPPLGVGIGLELRWDREVIVCLCLTSLLAINSACFRCFYMVHLVDMEDVATVSSSTSRVEVAGSNNGFLLVVSFRQFWWTLFKRSYMKLNK